MAEPESRERLGCEVSIATDGAEAVGFSGAQRFDVIFIALTASAMPTELRLCTDAGMNDVLVKPSRIAELHALLEKWSAMRGRERVPD